MLVAYFLVISSYKAINALFYMNIFNNYQANNPLITAYLY